MTDKVLGWNLSVAGWVLTALVAPVLYIDAQYFWGGAVSGLGLALVWTGGRLIEKGEK